MNRLRPPPFNSLRLPPLLPTIITLAAVVSFLPEPGHSERARLDRTPNGESPVLYHAGVDKLLGLDEETFYDTVFNSSTPIIVEVYKDWCGFCRAFAPVYREFAKSVENWRDVVQLAAVNCADLHNRVVCKAAQHVGKKTVPSMKFIPAGATSLEGEFEFEPPVRTVEALRTALVNTLAVNGSRPELMRTEMLELDEEKNNTNSSESSDSLIGKIWSEKIHSHSISHLALVFEDPSANFDVNGSNMTMGAQMRMDLYPYREHIHVLSANASSPLTRHLNITSYPHMSFYGRGNSSGENDTSNSTLDGSQDSTLPTLLYNGAANFNATKKLVRLAHLEPVGSQRDEPHRVELWRSRLINCKREPERCRHLYYVSENDMLKALRMALYNEVLHKEDVRGRDFDNLRTFLQLLIEHFPTATKSRAPRASADVPMSRSSNARAFFTSLASFMDARMERHNFTSDEWNSTFLENESRYFSPFPRKSSWEHCQGTLPEFRGFTCGLWTAFHAMTINSYTKQKDSKGGGWSEKDYGDSAQMEFAYRPLLAIRGWVASFFSCGGCRYHFLRMTDEELPLNGSNMHRPEDVFLYLWRAHNRANRRLKGDLTEDPQFIKRQFPPRFLCPKCYSDDGGDDKKSGDDGANGAKSSATKPKEWVMKEVEDFLINYYTRIKSHHQPLATKAKEETSGSNMGVDVKAGG